MVINFEKPPTDEVIELSADDLIEGEGDEESVIELSETDIIKERSEDEYSPEALVKQNQALLSPRSLRKDVGVVGPAVNKLQSSEELSADDIEIIDDNEVLLSEVPKSYDVTGSIVKRESPDGRKLSIIGTNKKERGSKDVVEDAVVMNLENGIFALGDSHEVKGKVGSGVDAAKNFTKLFSEFKGVSKESLSVGSEDQIKQEFVDSLKPIAENFAAKEKEITCSLVQMHENPDGSRTAVVYNVGDSMILKVNKENGAGERLGQFDQAGEELFEMFVRSNDSDDLWSMDHPMINKLKSEGADNLVSYFKGINYQDTFDYFKCAKIIANDSNLSDMEKKNYRDSLDVLNAKMSKTFEAKNVTTDRVQVLKLKQGEVLLELSDGIIDNIDVQSAEFKAAVMGGKAGIELFLDKAMAGARKKDDFSINVIE